jgi:hypothetical protein
MQAVNNLTRQQMHGYVMLERLSVPGERLLLSGSSVTEAVAGSSPDDEGLCEKRM